MRASKRIGFISLAIAAMAFSVAGTASAQLNEKRFERQATGFYKGKTTNGKNKFKTNGVVTFVGTPDDGQGRMRIPVKDGGLKTKVVDKDLPAANDKAKFKGREKKSDVRRNGKKIAVVANGNVDDGVHNKTKGKVRGSITDRGSKWVASVKLKGERKDQFDPADSNCFISNAKGRH